MIRSVRTLLAVLCLAGLAVVVPATGAGATNTCVDGQGTPFPGSMLVAGHYHAAWFQDLEKYNPSTSTWTQITSKVDSDTSISVPPGWLIRVDLHICSDEALDASDSAAVLQFRDAAPVSGVGQPQWNSRPKVKVEAGQVNTNLTISRAWQVNRPANGTDTWELEPILKHPGSTVVGDGFKVIVTPSGTAVTPPGNTAGPSNGDCSQSGGKVATVDEVYDNEKGGAVSGTTSWSSTTHYIHVVLDSANALAPVVGETMTMEQAGNYNGAWTVVGTGSTPAAPSNPTAGGYYTTGPASDPGSFNTNNLPHSLRYVTSNEAVPQGISLDILVQVCANTSGTYYGSLKVEPPSTSDAFKSWDNEDLLSADLGGTTTVRREYYQTAPCIDETFDLAPRLLDAFGTLPDSSTHLLAEGPHFLVNLNSATAGKRARC